MHVGNDITEESNRAIKRTKKEKQFQKYFHFMPLLRQLFEQNSSLSGSAGI
jgi:hypothetical protein